MRPPWLRSLWDPCEYNEAGKTPDLGDGVSRFDSAEDPDGDEALVFLIPKRRFRKLNFDGTELSFGSCGRASGAGRIEDEFDVGRDGRGPKEALDTALRSADSDLVIVVPLPALLLERMRDADVPPLTSTLPRASIDLGDEIPLPLLPGRLDEDSI